MAVGDCLGADALARRAQTNGVLASPADDLEVSLDSFFQIKALAMVAFQHVSIRLLIHRCRPVMLSGPGCYVWQALTRGSVSLLSYCQLYVSLFHQQAIYSPAPADMGVLLQTWQK